MQLTEEDERIILGLCDEAIQEMEQDKVFDESKLDEGILIYLRETGVIYEKITKILNSIYNGNNYEDIK